MGATHDCITLSIYDPADSMIRTVHVHIISEFHLLLLLCSYALYFSPAHHLW